MLAAIRAFSKTWFAKALLAVVMLSFLFIGARTTNLPSMMNNDVVEAGSRHINAADFKALFENYLQQAEQENGQAISATDAVAAGLDKRILNELADDESISEYLSRAGVKPADAMVADAVRHQTDFFDSVSGRFDQNRFDQWLSQRHLTEARYISLLQQQLALNHFNSGLAAGLRAPLAYGALEAGEAMKSRTLSYFTLTQGNLPPETPPTDAQLQAYIQKKGIMLPEMRMLTVVRFSAKALAPSLPVDQAAVQKLFAFRKDAASTPEKRSLVEIAAKDAGAAAAVAKRLKAGEPPAIIAKSIGAQPITYADAAKSAIVDPKVADAAFALKAGEVSGPIQGAMAGFPVVLVQSVTPAKAADFNAMRPALENQVRSDAAVKTTNAAVRKFDDLHSGGASLADAAKTAGVAIQTVGPITASGQSLDGQQAGLSPKALKDAFTLSQGGETDLVEEAAGEYYVVHVDRVIPQAPPRPQDAAFRPKLIQAYVNEDVMTRLQALGDSLAARLRKGEAIAQVAASASVTVAHAPPITPMSMARDQQLSPQLKGGIFSAKVGDVVVGAMAQGRVMVAHVDAVTAPDPAVAAPVIVQQSQQISGQIFQALGQAVRAAAVDAVKPKIHPDRALAALGVSPGDLAKAPGASKGPAQ